MRKKHSSGLNLFWRKSTPVILQSESAECGLASLLMVINHYGAGQDLTAFRSRHSLSARGVNLATLNEVACREGFETQAVSVELHEMPLLRLPCILHWDMDHFVVLVGFRGRNCIIHDPAIGRRVIPLQQVSRHFTGVALQLWPGAQVAPAAPVTPKLRISEMFRYIQGLKTALVKLFCLSLLVEMFSLIMPLGNQFIMDHVLPAQDIGLLTLICMAMFLMVITQTVIAVLRAWLTMTTGMQIQLQWRRGMFRHLLNLPILWFEKRKLGDIASRFSSLDTLRETFTTNIVQMILDGIMLIGTSAMMLLYAPALFAIVVMFTLLYAFMRLSTYRYMRQITEEQIVCSARQHSHFMESLYSVSTIRSMNMHEQRARSWYQLNVNELNANIKNAKFGIFYATTETFINAVDNIVVLWLGTQAVINGGLSLGMLLAFTSYRSLFSARAGSIITSALQIRMMSLHQERISDVLLSPPENFGSNENNHAAKTEKRVTLSCEQIGFRYDDFSQPVFSNISLSIPAGSSVAITGTSGCGKNYFAKDTCRFNSCAARCN